MCMTYLLVYSLCLLCPIEGACISIAPHQQWNAPRARRPHQGIDLLAPVGTSVKATWCGKVTFVGHSLYSGKFIWISHGSLQSGYAHLSKILVHRGKEVSKGQIIGQVGKTGYKLHQSHLHWALRLKKKYINPLKLECRKKNGR